jgi:hypothetical protein
MAADNEGDPDAYSKGNNDHFGHAFGAKARRKVRSGSEAEISCTFGTSGSVRIAAFEFRSQECHTATFRV